MQVLSAATATQQVNQNTKQIECAMDEAVDDEVGVDVAVDNADDETDEDEVVESSDDSDDSENGESLQTQLAEWATTNSIRQQALRSLISIIQPFVKETLPKDPRTIMNTPKSIELIEMGKGHYWHFGLEKCLRAIFENLSVSMELMLCFNIDGLPIGKSSQVAFWPILFKVQNVPNFKPMTIGIWCGKEKPAIDEYLRKFVDEMKHLLVNPIEIQTNIFISIKIHNFVCDSPARSYLKNTIQFNGYHGQEMYELSQM